MREKALWATLFILVALVAARAVVSTDLVRFDYRHRDLQLASQSSALMAEADDLANLGKHAEAMQRAEQALQLELKRTQEADTPPLFMLHFLAQQAWLADLRQPTLKYAEEEYLRNLSSYGESKISTIFSRWKLDYYTKMFAATSQQRTRIKELERQVEQLLDEEKYVEAVAALEKLAEQEAQVLSEAHPLYARRFTQIAESKLALDDTAAVEMAASQAIELLEKVSGETHYFKRRPHLLIGIARYRQENYQEAIKPLQAALMHNMAEDRSNTVAMLYVYLGYCWLHLKERSHAAQAFQSSFQKYDWLRDKDGKQQCIEGLQEVAFQCVNERDWDLAINSHERLHAWHVREYGKLHHATIDAQIKLEHARILRTLTPEQHQENDRVQQITKQIKTLLQAGDYPSGIPLAETAVEITQQVLGEKHLHYAISLNNLATLLEKVGEYDRAESLYDQSHDILLTVYGNQHPEYATHLAHMARIQKTKGDYERAEQIYLEATNIFLATLGRDSHLYGASAANLGLLYTTLGEYSRAAELLLESREILKNSTGEQSADYASVTNNLGMLYESLGNYVTAQFYIQESLAIRKSLYGEQHPEYATSLNNLAVIYRRLEDHDRAEQLFQETLQIQEGLPRKEHYSYAITLNNMGELYFDLEDYDRAEPLFLQAQDILKTVLETDHYFYAVILVNRGRLHTYREEHARAESLLQQACSIIEQSLGKPHPLYANALANMASVYDNMEDYDRAGPLYRQALEHWKTAGLERHSDYRITLISLAELYEKIGEEDNAESLYREAEYLDQESHDGAIRLPAPSSSL